MPAVTLGLNDLTPFATIDPVKATAMIDDAMALAARVAPCITLSSFEYAAAAKAILRGAILRWHEAGTGAVQSQTAGPFGQTLDTRQVRRGMFWPSEIIELQGLCGDAEPVGAFSVDTVPTSGAIVHSDICTLNFGGLYCSCGAILTQGLPLWEVG